MLSIVNLERTLFYYLLGCICAPCDRSNQDMKQIYDYTALPSKPLKNS